HIGRGCGGALSASKDALSAVAPRLKAPSDSSGQAACCVAAIEHPLSRLVSDPRIPFRDTDSLCDQRLRPLSSSWTFPMILSSSVGAQGAGWVRLYRIASVAS